MKFLTLLSLALVLSVSAAQASWISQSPGDPNATGLWINKGPTPGVDCPSGTFFCVFVPVGGDTTLSNYKIGSDGTQIYAPPAPSSPPIPPSPSAAKAAIMGDSNLTSTVKSAILQYIAIFNEYPGNSSSAKQDWTSLKANAPADISVSDFAEIESVCAQTGVGKPNMPLQ